MNLTKKRQLILDIIKNENLPINANLIYNKINKIEKCNLSTIYRSIEFLIKNNYVNKTNILNESYYFIKKEPHSHYSFCLKCNKLFEIPCNLNIKNFKVLDHDLVVYGYCKSCDK